MATSADGGSSNPPADPLPYNNVTYLGDNGGTTERFLVRHGCCQGRPAVDGITRDDVRVVDQHVDDPRLLDGNNVNFGYTNATRQARLVQYPLAPVGSYTCPSATPKLCTVSSNGPANTCSESDGGTYGEACRQCCVNSDCSGGLRRPHPGCAQRRHARRGVLGAALPAQRGGCLQHRRVHVHVQLGLRQLHRHDPDDRLPDRPRHGRQQLRRVRDDLLDEQHPDRRSAPAGACTGQCTDGWVDCNANRQSDGCEAPPSCGQCCTSSGAARWSARVGTVCYDVGVRRNAPDVGAVCVYDPDDPWPSGAASIRAAAVSRRRARRDRRSRGSPSPTTGTPARCRRGRAGRIRPTATAASLAWPPAMPSRAASGRPPTAASATTQVAGTRPPARRARRARRLLVEQHHGDLLADGVSQPGDLGQRALR